MIVTQKEFAEGLLDAARPTPDGVCNPDGTTASKRYDVYRNNVAVSLADALEVAFPVVRKLVGDEFFRAVAGVYLRQHPPSSPLLMFFGEHMADFLRSFPPAQTLPYLPDVAAVEQALRRAYHASDAEPIQPDALARVAPDALMALRMEFAPALQIIRSDFPIYGIYRSNTDANPTKPVMQAEIALITRPEFDPELHLITAADAALIETLQSGKSLGDAMAAAGDTLDLGQILGLLLRQSAVTKLF